MCSPAVAAVALRDLASAMSESSAFREGITLRCVRMSLNWAFVAFLLVLSFFWSRRGNGGGRARSAMSSKGNAPCKALRAFL